MTKYALALHFDVEADFDVEAGSLEEARQKLAAVATDEELHLAASTFLAAYTGGNGLDAMRAAFATRSRPSTLTDELYSSLKEAAEERDRERVELLLSGLEPQSAKLARALLVAEELIEMMDWVGTGSSDGYEEAREYRQKLDEIRNAQ